MMIHNVSTQLISDAWDYKIFIQITLDFPNSTLLFGALGGLLISKSRCAKISQTIKLHILSSQHVRLQNPRPCGLLSDTPRKEPQRSRGRSKSNSKCQGVTGNACKDHGEGKRRPANINHSANPTQAGEDQQLFRREECTTLCSEMEITHG
jgi:hypothetical protein